MSLRGTGVVAGASLVVGLLPAGAVAVGSDPAPSTRLVLQVKEEGSARRTVNLRCNPPSGDHPNRSSACEEIADAGGDFDRLRGRQTFAACAKIYLPVRVKANGVAEGKVVDYKRTFPNRCEMGVATGSVFEVWPAD